MRAKFFVLYFSKEQNNLITDKRNLEEQWLGLGLFFVLYFYVLYFLCCIFPYGKYSLDSELKLTMQNIDFT